MNAWTSNQSGLTANIAERNRGFLWQSSAGGGKDGGGKQGDGDKSLPAPKPNKWDDPVPAAPPDDYGDRY